MSWIKSKHLLHSTQTTIGLHDDRDAVSNIIRANGIWEEQYLFCYPQINFIVAGTNVRAYTMVVAALGRTVLSIECFKPHIQRIRRAVQIEKYSKCCDESGYSMVRNSFVCNRWKSV